MPESLLIDRSRISTFFHCPRAYYWFYVHNGRGVAPVKRAIPLAVGGSVHKGLENLLRGASEETAVAEAKRAFREELTTYEGLDLKASEEVLFVYREQELLVEALVRVYSMHGLPSLLARFEIVEVEQEAEIELAPNVTFMSRADGLLRKRTNGGLYVLSFKTAKAYTKRHAADGNHDVQGLSEIAALAPRLGEEIFGAQMEYLVKGTRTEFPSDSGRFVQNTGLLHPWAKTEGGGTQWAWRWKWQDSTGGHTLGKGWQRVNIWEYMSVKDWLGLLASGQVQPEAGDPLESILISPEPYMRRGQEVEDWKEQTASVGQRLGTSPPVPPPDSGDFHSWLNKSYPQNRRACDWPTRCPAQDLCFGVASSDPVGSGIYQLRKAHHDREIETFGEEDS